MQYEIKPFTAFGAILKQVRLANITPTYSMFFFVGRYAYQEAKKVLSSSQIALCLPIGQALDDYSWPINGIRLLLFDTGSMTSLGISKIAYGLLKHGAAQVAVCSDQKLRTDVFSLKKDLQHGKNTNR